MAKSSSVLRDPRVPLELRRRVDPADGLLDYPMPDGGEVLIETCMEHLCEAAKRDDTDGIANAMVLACAWALFLEREQICAVLDRIIATSDPADFSSHDRAMARGARLYAAKLKDEILNPSQVNK